MKSVVLLTITYLLHCDCGVTVSRDEQLNDRPIIGVLSQELSIYLHSLYPKEKYTSYIAAAFVKDIEASGARVVPILIGRDRVYYEELMKKINGVMMPGGTASFIRGGGYADAGQHIYEIAKQMNDRGDYFPIFGTCLGYELLIILASGRGLIQNRDICYAFGNLPLWFAPDYQKSKMFSAAPDDVLEILTTQNLTLQGHRLCITDKNLKRHGLVNDWLPTTYSVNKYGIKFISSIEHKRYPFYGIHFHPEAKFEWNFDYKYPHFGEAIKANRHFMDFLVNESRKSGHSFANETEEYQTLIYNYGPLFTGGFGSAFHQCYMFEPRGVINK